MMPHGNLDFHADRFAQQAEKVILDTNKIPFLGGRPQRDTIISEDDICNLKIALETAPSFSAFLKMI
jgi:hypothetical protein